MIYAHDPVLAKIRRPIRYINPLSTASGDFIFSPRITEGGVPEPRHLGADDQDGFGLAGAALRGARTRQARPSRS